MIVRLNLGVIKSFDLACIGRISLLSSKAGMGGWHLLLICLILPRPRFHSHRPLHTLHPLHYRRLPRPAHRPHSPSTIRHAHQTD